MKNMRLMSATRAHMPLLNVPLYNLRSEFDTLDVIYCACELW